MSEHGFNPEGAHMQAVIERNTKKLDEYLARSTHDIFYSVQEREVRGYQFPRLQELDAVRFEQLKQSVEQLRFDLVQDLSNKAFAEGLHRVNQFADELESDASLKLGPEQCVTEVDALRQWLGAVRMRFGGIADRKA